MPVAMLGCRQIMLRGKIPSHALASCRGQCCDRHAAPLAKASLVGIGLHTLLGGVGTNLPLRRVFAPLIKDSHVKKSLGILHTKQKISTKQRFFLEASAGKRCKTRVIV